MDREEQSDPPASVVSAERVEWIGGRATPAADQVAREEPLEIRVGGVPLAVVMRTPGHDEELVRGFLLTEGIVADVAHIASVRHCSDAPEDNVMQVVLGGGPPLDLARLRRNLYASSSCGVCGKATLEAAMARSPSLHDALQVSAQLLYQLPARLAAAQEGFALTGGLHAAGLFTADGGLRVVREDIGRHNAVDKVVGWAGVNAVGGLLLVSGRVSFEIVQKALAARIPVVAAVSAPSSLAIDLARQAGVTLVAFLRGERLCVYSGGERVAP